MKTKKILSVSAVALLLFAVGAASAADLTHNAASTLTLTGVQSFDNVRIGNLSSSAATIVDATGTTSFTANGTQFFVGAGPSGQSNMTGTLRLGPSNTITANQVTIGGLEPDFNGTNGHAGLVTTLANSITTINAANMAVGTGKAIGTQIVGQTGGKFTLGSGATLNLYGLTGSNSRAALVLGRFNVNTAIRGQGNMDLSAGTANLVLSELSLGRTLADDGLGGTDPTAGTLTLSTNGSNHLDISGAGNVVKIGYRTTSNRNTIGTLTIGNLNSTSSITSTDNSTAMLIGYRPSGTGTVSGTFNFNGGTLKITTTGAAIAGGGGTTSALNLSGGAKLVAGSNSSNWIHSLTAATIGTGGAIFDTDGNTISIGQAFTGAGSLTKAGAGTLTLNGANGYTGQTIVDAGKLLVNGSTHANSAAQVNAGTLGGTGTINGSTTVISGATLAPGNSIGTLAVGSNLTLNSGSFFDWEFNSTSVLADLLNVNGAVNLTGSNLQLSDFDSSIPVLSVGDKFTLISYSGSLTGTFAGLNENDIFSDAGYLWQIKYADTAGLNGGAHANNITLTVAIPEPSSLAMLAFGLISLWLFRNKKV